MARLGPQQPCNLATMNHVHMGNAFGERRINTFSLQHHVLVREVTDERLKQTTYLLHSSIFASVRHSATTSLGTYFTASVVSYNEVSRP